MPFSSAPFGAPIFDVDVQNPPTDGVGEISQSGEVDRVILVEFNALPRTFTLDWPAKGPIFDQAIFGDPGPTTATQLPTATTFLFSNRAWIPKPNDLNRPNAWYEPRLLNGYSVQRSLPLLPEATRRSQQQIASISLNNADRSYDGIISSFGVEGRNLSIRMGTPNDSWSGFRLMLAAIIQDWSATRTQISISLQDLTFRIERYVQITFGGNGGLDGTPDLVGKSYPEVYGHCLNITPVQIDPANRMFMVHWRGVQSIDAVYDGGFPLTFFGDFATMTDLLAATIPPGNFATCRAQGIFRLASLPQFLITCDVQGDVDDTGSYINDIGGILLRIYRDRLKLTTAEYVGATFGVLGRGEAGWYLSPDSRPKGDEVTDAILTACGLGWYGNTREARIRVQTIPVPEDTVARYFFTKEDIVNFQRLEAPAPPRYRQEVAYARNWTTQAEADLATGLTDDQRAYQTRQYSTTFKSNSDVVLANKTAIAGQAILSPFISQPDAQALARQIMTLHGAQRDLFQITLKRSGYLVDLALVINVTYDRYGLDAGKNFTIIAMNEDAGRDRVTLTVWG